MKSKRGMGSATKGGGCCAPCEPRKYATGSPEEGVTKDMLPWMSKANKYKQLSDEDSAEGVTKDMLPWMSKEVPKPSPRRNYGAAEGITPDMVKMLTKIRKKKPRPPRMEDYPFEPRVPRQNRR